ncbi:TetR/AcrR family transcriptional regulator [Methylosinus sp. RM1]|uniref:TetR/AcrR family transcriptional regulator n=1 Tax=Methylosinus sp. RM1 TaxID=2583817 RepID=UPI001FEF9BCB|nr:TetR/AcrR family transcriptional regulator [Methylosinus sp. RM1]
MQRSRAISPYLDPIGTDSARVFSVARILIDRTTFVREDSDDDPGRRACGFRASVRRTPVGQKGTAMNAKPQTVENEAMENRATPRKEIILTAARTQFLKQGFSETSMGAIARAAGVSKATLYVYFANKEDLFADLVESEFRTTVLCCAEPDLGLGLEPALRGLAREFVGCWLRKDSTAFFQAVCSERWRFPGLCLLVFESNQRAALELLISVFEEAEREGLLAFPNAKIAAAHLLHLVFADMPLRIALGVAPPSKAEAEATLQAGIDCFLRAYGTPRLAPRG